MRRFWRGFIIFISGGALGTAFGVALGFFFFPFVFPPPPASEVIGEIAGSRLVASGTFIHANPSDPVHWGKGKVGVTAAVATLGGSSASRPAFHHLQYHAVDPDAHVRLVPRRFSAVPGSAVAGADNTRWKVR